MKKFICKAFAPFTVRVYWGSRVITHKAWSYRESLQWVRCYPLGADVVVRKWGKFQFYRGLSV